MCGWFSDARIFASRWKRRAVGVVRECVGEDLDRDVSVQLRVAGPIDLPHPAFADRRDDFVGTEAGARSEGHVLRIIRL